jgi:hypothetical protein
METVVVPAAGGRRLEGDLRIPADARGVVLFAHGSGSGRHSPRNQLVAATLDQAGFATLLLDLLTAEEEAAEQAGGMLRFDVGLLAEQYDPHDDRQLGNFPQAFSHVALVNTAQNLNRRGGRRPRQRARRGEPDRAG